MNRALTYSTACLGTVLVATVAGCRPSPEPAPETGIPAAAQSLIPENPAAVSAGDRSRIREFWAVYNRAVDEKGKGLWEAAAVDYSRALQLNPSHWDALYYLGNCRMELGRFTEAEEAYRKLAHSDPQAARAHSALGALYSNAKAGNLFDLGKAEEAYRRSWRNNGDESGSVIRIGEVALAAGKDSEAKEFLSAAAKTNPRSVSARILLGYLAWKGGDSVSAYAKAKEALELTKVQKPPMGVLGEGDTKLPGSRAMVMPGQRGLFDHLAGKLWGRPSMSKSEVDALFGQVRAFILALPRKRAAN